MSNDIKVPPLFFEKKDGKIIVLDAKVRAGDKTYTLYKFIRKVTEKVLPMATKLIEQKSHGELVVAGNLLLELSHRLKLGETIASQIEVNPAMLYTYSLIFALGMQAGSVIPEEVNFESTKTEGLDPVLRAILKHKGNIGEA